MCGITGYSGRDPVDPIRMRFLLAENEDRGGDSVGIYGNYLSKDNTNARNFIINTDFDDIIDGSKTVIAHTRKATTGAKTKENAHPFHIFVKDGKSPDPNREVIGTHNGWIFDEVFKDVCKKHDITEPNVDSQLIYEMLVRNDFDFDVLSEIEGTMALAFTRPLYPNLLYLYRRFNKPLHIGFVGKNMYYSSEDVPLHLIGCENVQELDADKIHIFQNGGLLEVSPVKKPVITSIKEDEGLTMWRARATRAELEAAKLPVITLGTTAKNTDTATANKGGTGNLFGAPSGRMGPNPAQKIMMDGQLRFLDGIPPAPYINAALDSPDKGKWENSGYPDRCYYILKLVDSRYGYPLIGWDVRAAANPNISGLSVHNGLLVLCLPEAFCGKPVRFKISHPLVPEKQFTVVLNPQAGRIMEVILSLPFLWEEEEEKKSESNSSGESLDSSNERKGEGQTNNNPLNTIEQEVNEIFGDVQKGLFCDGQAGSGTVRDRSKRRLGYSHTDKTFLVGGIVVNSGFDFDSNILDMDNYTAGVALDEIKTFKKDVGETLSSLDSTHDKNKLQRMMSFFEWFESYFETRIEKTTERDEAFNRHGGN